LAVAPVDIINVLARTGSVDHVGHTLNGCEERSTFSIVFVWIRVSEFKDCCLMFIINSGPPIPSGNHGKFSTSVVVVNCPPAATPPAKNPSNINGFNIALPA
jgi:hypothetical protein